MVNQASGMPRKPVTLRLRQVGTTEHTGEVVLQLLRETLQGNCPVVTAGSSCLHCTKY